MFPSTAEVAYGDRASRAEPFFNRQTRAWVITSLVTPTWTCSGRRARGGPSRPLTRQRFAARGRPVFRALFYRLLRLLHVLDQLVQAPVVVVRDIGPPLAAPELGYDFVDGQFRRFGQQVGNEKLAPAEPSLSTLGP